MLLTGHPRSVRTQSSGAAAMLPGAGTGSEKRFLYWRSGGDFFVAVCLVTLYKTLG